MGGEEETCGQVLSWLLSLELLRLSVCVCPFFLSLSLSHTPTHANHHLTQPDIFYTHGTQMCPPIHGKCVYINGPSPPFSPLMHLSHLPWHHSYSSAWIRHVSLVYFGVLKNCCVCEREDICHAILKWHYLYFILGLVASKLLCLHTYRGFSVCVWVWWSSVASKLFCKMDYSILLLRYRS